LCLLGGNDFLRRISQKRRSQPRIIVDRVRQHGVAVVLVGIGIGLLADPYVRNTKRWRNGPRRSLVSHILRGIIGQVDLMSDSIHPNDRGYAIVADRLEPVLAI